MSLTKNLKTLTNLAPRPVVTWDKCERIRRNKAIWDDKDSIVHRLPLHYQQRYWKNILSDAKPVHYRIPKSRFYWDPVRLVEVEVEHYPILPVKVPEADEGLWGGEGVIKGYKESNPKVTKKILPRWWIPELWVPKVKDAILYSEVLDQYMQIRVTERALRLIDESFGLDYYLLETPDIDIASKLGLKLKRQIMISLAKEDYYSNDQERHSYIKDKYAKYVIPLEEAEWIGLDLNEACKKLQNIELATAPEPLKYVYEREMVEKLESGELPEEDDTFKPQKSLFGERLLGRYMDPLARKFRS